MRRILVMTQKWQPVWQQMATAKWCDPSFQSGVLRKWKWDMDLDERADPGNPAIAGFDSGPIIPNSLFPIHVNAVSNHNGASFSGVFDGDVPALMAASAITVR